MYFIFLNMFQSVSEKWGTNVLGLCIVEGQGISLRAVHTSCVLHVVLLPVPECCIVN
jgi:hypothetical protein